MALFSALSNLFFDDPSKKAKKYLNQIPDQLHQGYDPYVKAGQQALPGLQDQYSQLMNDPGGRLNEIGQGYKESPGFQFALKQALQGASHAASAGGLAGTPQHERWAMDEATGVASKDYHDWISQALGLYGGGLQGQQGLYDTGYNANNELTQSLSNLLSGQAGLAYSGQANQNQAFGGLAGTALGAFGGPMGMAIGNKIGSSIGGGGSPDMGGGTAVQNQLNKYFGRGG